MKKIFKNMDKKLFLATIVLFAFGSIMILSASSIKAYMFDNSPSIYFQRQVFFLMVGFALSCVLIRIPTSKYKKLSWPALIGVSGLILFTLLYSIAINATKGWLNIGKFGGQPSELAKIVMIVWLSCFYGNSKDPNFYENKKKIWFSLCVIAGFTLMIVLQNDYGTALIILAISMFIFFISNISKKIKLEVLLFGMGFIALILTLVFTGKLTLLTSDKLARFNIVDPCGRYLNKGNQVCNSYIAINGGGILGKGLGNSTQKYLYLPEAHTDFIFAIIVEELGLFGGMGLILFYMFILIRIVLIGRRTNKDYNALMCYGIAMYLFLHIVINLGGVTGLIPITGIPLPFMSYGGTFALSLVFALAIVQRINYENNLQKK